MAAKSRHTELSSQLLEYARIELQNGDTIQAAEKAWGAVAHFVKAIAVAQGWPNETHRHPLSNARRLLDLTPVPDLNLVRLSAVRQLHQNFYEDDPDPADVSVHIDAAEELLVALKIANQSPP